jgi:hypothetical protein
MVGCPRSMGFTQSGQAPRPYLDRAAVSAAFLAGLLILMSAQDSGRYS